MCGIWIGRQDQKNVSLYQLIIIIKIQMMMTIKLSKYNQDNRKISLTLMNWINYQIIITNSNSNPNHNSEPNSIS